MQVFTVCCHPWLRYFCRYLYTCCTLQVEKIIPKAGQPEYKFFLFTHIDFEIKANGENVIEINVLTDPNQAVDISENTKDVKVRARGVYARTVPHMWFFWPGAGPPAARFDERAYACDSGHHNCMMCGSLKVTPVGRGWQSSRGEALPHAHLVRPPAAG